MYSCLVPPLQAAGARILLVVLLGGGKKVLNRPNREAVEPEVVALRIHAPAVEEQDPTIRGGVKRTRPVVAIRTAIDPRLPIAEAGAGEE